MTNPAHKISPAARGRLQRAASYTSLSVALLLVGAKIWGWQQTSSVALLSSLVDSFLDVMASGITVVAVRVALRPADSEHRFGHGKAEGLAALAQSLIITASAIYVLTEAIERLFVPQAIAKPEIGVGVMALSIVLTTCLVLFQNSVVKKTGSMAISADAMHYRADLFVNVGVLAAIPLTNLTGITYIDPMVGIAIAVYILFGTFEMGSNALDVLLDRELSHEKRKRIEAVAREHPAVKGFHDLRTRFGGNRYFIQFHLELDPDMTLLHAHLIMDEIEDKVRAMFPRCEIIVHTDPLGFEEKRDSFD